MQIKIRSPDGRNSVTKTSAVSLVLRPIVYVVTLNPTWPRIRREPVFSADVLVVVADDAILNGADMSVGKSCMKRVTTEDGHSILHDLWMLK